MEKIIEIVNLKKRFGDKEVLKGVNLTVNKGDTLVIIGSSGCGKSVLLKLIIGLIEPEEGSIFIEGVDIVKLNKKELYKIRAKFGFQFQGSALFDSMTVEENIGLALRENTNLSSKEIKKIVAEKLEIVGLPGIENLMPADLSGGMKKRVALARSLATNPQIILYDEPTTGLDPIMSNNIDEFIKELSERLKVTSIVVTHDIFTVLHIADYVAMLYDGRIYFHGKPKELMNSKDNIIVEFLSRTTQRNLSRR